MRIPHVLGDRAFRTLLLPALGVIALSGVACSSSSSTSTPAAQTTATSSAGTAGSAGTVATANIPTVNVSAREYAYDAPDSIPAGLTRIHMQNTGKEDHQAQLLKLNAGVTLAQFQAALQQSPNNVIKVSTAEGGPNAEKAGEAADAVSNLQPGQYVFICFVPSADRVPHVAKGMIKPLQVTAGSPSPAAQLPPTQTTVTGREFSFDSPTTLTSGSTTITFKNAGTQPHEMSLVKLNVGVTPDEVKAALSAPRGGAPAGPPPFSSEGGMGGISPGETGQTTVNLTSGTYVLICNIPDTNTGKPHVALGMISSFNVR